ncbi:hypothetical protein PAECIP111892_05043 [Paenibacillus auburnensis]|uniref:DUF5107 domain-containing protein n=1 Tax=Paenibacillus auburnensis TaxID=2905649 RepID=A0ABM9CT11_9BACL|nr:DUF4432 family protein [Paenibacillus auburnensis]CAH1221780.1 hypothetical protein PAECIP111892_05043 [Paenibacillus auburnensis]
MQEAVWSEYLHQGYICLKGENDFFSVTIVPQRGSKIVSLLDKRNEREWIYRTDQPWEPLKLGMDWGAGDRGGWDEMFPTINASSCPDKGYEHVSFPDHGEVWSREWNYALLGAQLRLEICGVQLPYTLRKTVSLSGSSLIIHYELENLGTQLFSYLWAAHPLLKVEPGMQLRTSPAEGRIQLTYSHRERLGGLHALSSFPIAATKEGGVTDLSTLEDASGGHAEKYYFTDPLQEGYAGISDPFTGAEISFHFDSEEVPYLAIWAHYGAMGDYTVAPEPATGYLDSVQEAYNRGKVKRIAGHSIDRWRLEIRLQADCLTSGVDK